MRRFFYNLLLIVLPVGLLVSLSNYFIDPANIFSSKKYVAGIADILAKGHNVNNVANYDERLFQEQMVTKIPETPDIVVVGSSRIMEIGSDFFTGKKVLNCGVSHANIKDVLAIMGILDDVNKLPKKIVLNLDPFLICKGGSTEWQSISPYYTSFTTKLKLGEALNNESSTLYHTKLYSLISFEYFEKSLKFILDGSSKKYEDVGQQKPSTYGRFSDGTICYPYSYTHADTIKVSEDSRNLANTEKFEIDSSKLFLLNGLLDFLSEKNIEVRFVMLPFHHQYYTIINQKQAYNFQNYEIFFTQLAQQRHITITGSFDAIKEGVSASEFYDTYHCSKEAIKKMFPINSL